MNKFKSMFGQVFQIFSKKVLLGSEKTQAEKGAKLSSRWEQFLVMLFCQLVHFHLLGEICRDHVSCVG